MYSLSLTIMTVLPGIAVGYMISKETIEEKNFKPIYLRYSSIYGVYDGFCRTK